MAEERKQKKKITDIVNNIEKLMEYETAGDPISGLKWTRKTTKKVSEELASIDIIVSKTTVGKILKKLNFSLKSNSKKISNGGKSVKKEDQEKRDLQFNYINRIRKIFFNKGMPEISSDTKKKELIGNFNPEGSGWYSIQTYG